MQRPTGVTILAILAIIGGLLGILAGLAGIGLLAGTGSPPPLALALGVVALALGILELVTGAGMWQLKRWAWPLALAIFGLEAINRIVGLFTSRSVGSILGLAISVIIVWYLFRPDVRRAFGRD